MGGAVVVGHLASSKASATAKRFSVIQADFELLGWVNKSVTTPHEKISHNGGGRKVFGGNVMGRAVAVGHLVSLKAMTTSKEFSVIQAAIELPDWGGRGDLHTNWKIYSQWKRSETVRRAHHGGRRGGLSLGIVEGDSRNQKQLCDSD